MPFLYSFLAFVNGQLLAYAVYLCKIELRGDIYGNKGYFI